MAQDFTNVLEAWNLRFSNDNDSKERIEKLYLPVLERILEWKKSSKTLPFIVGINGSQGIGKSTLCSALVEAITLLGLRSISISIDDFYINYYRSGRRTFRLRLLPWMTG